MQEQLSKLQLHQQSRQPDEVLIGDDSPNDALKDAVEDFKKSSPPLSFDLKYIKNPVQRGVDENFLFLAGAASGDLIFFCDQDDFWLPEKIRVLSEVLEKEKDIDVVSCFSTWTDAELTPWKIQDMTELNYLQKNSQGNLFNPVLRSRLVAVGHNIALRKSILPKLPKWENFLYDSWIIRSAAAANSLKFIPIRLTLHRIHSSNLTVSPEFSFGNSLAQQRRRNGTAELTNLRDEWVLFRKNLSLSPLFEEISELNKKMLDQYISYLEKRLFCRRKDPVMRFVLCLLMLPDYFRFGNKFRSAARDIAGL